MYELRQKFAVQNGYVVVKDGQEIAEMVSPSGDPERAKALCERLIRDANQE